MNKSNTGIFDIGVFIISVFFFFAFSQMSTLAILGCSTFVFFTVRFFNDLGTKLEIRDLMIIIALLQWVVGPVLSYSYFADDEMYKMSVSQVVYMNYVVPATFAFIFGLYLPIYSKKRHEEEKLNRVKELMNYQPNLDLILIGIGVVAGVIQSSMPDSLGFFFYLLGCLRYIGLYFLLLNGTRKNKIFYIIPVLAWLFLHALGDGMFHDLLLWMGFLFLVAAVINKINLQQKIIYISFLIFLVLIIQVAKHEYRKQIDDIERQQGAWTTISEKGSVFSDIVQNKLSAPTEIFSRVYLSYNVTRINQGWIIARIMDHTPRLEPFANGETISDGLYALLPRFLFPDKAIAGGRKNFQRFTGKTLREGTSMNLSVIGEAYANYGVGGGIFFMFWLALLFNYVLGLIFKLSDRFPSLILWIPLIFLQVIKAETDFVTVINYLFKAVVVVWMLFFSLQRLFKFKF